MTNEEAIYIINNTAWLGTDKGIEVYPAVKKAVEALEKKIPKKPTKSKAVIAGANYAYWCPACKKCFTLHGSFDGRNKYCDMCGQAIDWSEVNE